MERKNSDGGRLMIVLGVLCLVAIGLLIGVIVKMNLPSDKWVELGENGEMVNCGDIKRLDDMSDIVNCIGIMYDEEGEEKALKEYDRVISETYENGDYDYFGEAIIGRARLYLDDEGNGCEKALSMIEDERIEGMPAYERFLFYEDAMELTDDCEDTEKSEFYGSKMDEIINNNEDGVLDEVLGE